MEQPIVRSLQGLLYSSFQPKGGVVGGAVPNGGVVVGGGHTPVGPGVGVHVGTGVGGGLVNR